MLKEDALNAQKDSISKVEFVFNPILYVKHLAKLMELVYLVIQAMFLVEYPVSLVNHLYKMIQIVLNFDMEYVKDALLGLS